MASEAMPTLPGAAVQLAKRISCPLTEGLPNVAKRCGT